jgi:hypothetical protein
MALGTAMMRTNPEIYRFTEFNRGTIPGDFLMLGFPFRKRPCFAEIPDWLILRSVM